MRPVRQPSGWVRVALLDLEVVTADDDRRQADAAMLDATEHAEFAGLVKEADRLRRIATRAQLHRLVAGTLGTTPSQVRLHKESTGRLVLDGPQSSGVAVSASHTRSLGAVALAGDAVGMDVERRDPEALSEASAAFLSDEEQAAIARRPCSERDDLMLALWTGKEAVVKALGVGFSGCEPNRVCFAVPPVGPPSLALAIDHDHEPSLVVRWFTAGADHLGAVAAAPVP
jgi:4'-phosphopantetheinyl transferase